MSSKLLCTDVLAIHCTNDVVFVGMGCVLHVFWKNTCKLKTKLKCLYPNNIHGIISGPDNKLVVFGAKSVCIYDFNVKDDVIIIKEHVNVQYHDWIIAMRWVLIDNALKLGILFSHNNVCIYDIHNAHEQVFWCDEKCILYGGSISEDSDKSLIVLSGTVFQEILIWKISHDLKHESTAKVLHRLTGHNGVIFSVIYDPCTQLICSTSDDRTLRLWKVIDNSKSGAVNWQKAEVKLLKTMFGHVSRVWRAMIRDNIVITIGEDSLMCTWSTSGELLNKVLAHHGAPIWSIDVLENNEFIVTGGADGAVYMWPFTYNGTPKIISLSKNKMQKISKYICQLKSGSILIFNEGGVLLAYNIEENSPRESLHLEKYNSYCIMQASPCRSYVAFASREGYVTIYEEIDNTKSKQLQEVLEERIMESQIFSLHWLNTTTLLICGPSGTLKIAKFITTARTLHVQSEYLLPACQECWVTAAIIYNRLLICGDRGGNLHAFELHENGETNVNSKIKKPVQTITKIHGRIGIQSFTTLDSKLMSTGRDGILRFYELHISNNKRTLHVLHGKRMPMDWISGTLKCNNDMLLLGFKEVEFVMYSTSSERIFLRIPCGGGHRSWDCVVINDIINFVYIRNKQVYLYTYPLNTLKLPVILNGFHVKEVYCIEPILKTNCQTIFASGGEDCALRICCATNTAVENHDYTFYTLGTFDGHLSSIRSIATMSVEITAAHSKYLVFSCGGRAQLKIWEISINNQEAVIRNDISCTDIKSHMLYGHDQNRKKHWQDTKQPYVIDPETRYMDISIYSPENSDRLLIFIACADGYLRIFEYGLSNSDFHLRLSAKCAERCILKLHILLHEQKIILLTFATDGIVRFFDFTNTIYGILDGTFNNRHNSEVNDTVPCAKLNLHQSGINSYDIKLMKDNEYLLVTGGDDNLLSLVSFQILMSDEKVIYITIQAKWSTADTHSAQITAVKFRGANKIYSAGMDQEIIAYAYEFCDIEKNLHVNILNKIFTSIADVQGMVLWSSLLDEDESSVCVYGKGFEILSL